MTLVAAALACGSSSKQPGFRCSSPEGEKTRALPRRPRRRPRRGRGSRPPRRQAHRSDRHHAARAAPEPRRTDWRPLVEATTFISPTAQIQSQPTTTFEFWRRPPPSSAARRVGRRRGVRTSARRQCSGTFVDIIARPARSSTTHEQRMLTAEDEKSREEAARAAASGDRAPPPPRARGRAAGAADAAPTVPAAFVGCGGNGECAPDARTRRGACRTYGAPASRRSCCSQRASMATIASARTRVETIPASPQPPRGAPSARRVRSNPQGGHSSARRRPAERHNCRRRIIVTGHLLASSRLSDVTEGPNEELPSPSAEDPESIIAVRSEVTEAKEEREGGDLRI